MLWARIRTAVLLGGAIVAVVLALPPLWTIAVLAAILLVGVWEWSKFVTARPSGRLTYVVASVALLAVVALLSHREAWLDALLVAAAVWWVIAFLWVVLAPQRVAPWSAAVAGGLALAPAWAAFAYLRLHSPQGGQWVMFAILLVVAADTGAFLVGKTLGRVKLAPAVSPGKTWEGVLGGLAFGAAAAAGGARWFDLPAGTFVLMCLGALAFSVVGDLTESMFKRHIGVKDSGAIFPGHGGVLDRIDSMTAAVPLLVLGLRWQGLS